MKKDVREEFMILYVAVTKRIAIFILGGLVSPSGSEVPVGSG